MALTFNAIQRMASFDRGFAFPLDKHSYFESYELAVAAAAIAAEPGTKAANNVVYYIGQTLVVNEGGKATLYIIQPDKTLKEVGSVPVGDGKSIEVVDGQIKLKGFGSGYYQYNQKYKPAPVEGEDNRAEDEKSQYNFIEGEFKAGLQPQVVAKASGEGFEIAWYEPNPTTVEGLQAQITALDGSVNNLTSKVDAKADASSLALYQKQAISSISGYASASTVEGALAEVMSQAMTNAGGITAVEGRVGTAEDSIKAMQPVLDAVSGTYATKSEVNALSTVYETISNVNAKLADYYTKEQADEKHEEVVEIAQGKTQTFVVNYADNEFLNSQDAELNVQQFFTIDGEAIAAGNIKPGDVILVVETDVPDRWVKQVNENDFVLAKLETTKVDLEPYATTSYVNEVRGGISQELLNYISGSISTVDKLVLVAGNNQIKETEYSIINSFTTGNNSTIPTTGAVTRNILNAISDRASKESVSDEASAREAADNALGERIAAEESARVTSDQALGKRIDDETSARETLAGRVETLETTYATKSELDAEAKTRKDADDALDVRLDAVEAQLGISDESGNSLTEQVSEIIKEVWGVSTIENFDFKTSSQIDNLKEGVSGILNEITSIKTNYATENFVGEAIEAASHINTVNAVNSAYVTAVASEDKSVSIGVTDKLKSVIDNAATSVSGGQYVSGSISENKLTIDDSQLVNAMNGLSNKFLSINTDYIKDISISAFTDNGLRIASMGISYADGSVYKVNLTDEIFGTPSIAKAITSMVASSRVAENLYALGYNLGEGFALDAGTLLSNLAAKGHPSELADGIFEAVGYIHTLGTKYDAGNVIKAVDWVSSNKDVVSNLASNAITSVQTSTLVATHSGNNLMIDLPSVIWLDGGSASDTYEAEEAVYNELLNNEYGN